MTPIEAELDHAGSDQARALTARLARDFELGGEGIKAALGGALADVQDLGDLGAGGGTAGKGTLAAVGRDQSGSGRPLLFIEGNAGAASGDGAARPARNRIGDFESVAADDQDIAVAQAARPVERLAVECGAITGLSRSVAIRTPPRFSISRWFQETASSSIWIPASGSRPRLCARRRAPPNGARHPHPSTRFARPSRREHRVPPGDRRRRREAHRRRSGGGVGRGRDDRAGWAPDRPSPTCCQLSPPAASATSAASPPRSPPRNRRASWASRSRSSANCSNSTSRSTAPTR